MKDKDQKNGHLDRIETKIDVLTDFAKKKFESQDKKSDSVDKKFDKLTDIVERGFGAVAEDISSLATKEDLITLGIQVSSIENELRDIKKRLFRIVDMTDKNHEQITEAFKRIAVIEKHLGIHTHTL